MKLLLAAPLAMMLLGMTQAVEKPAYLESYVEPETGCKVIRISGDPRTPIPNVPDQHRSDEVRHHY